MTDLKSRLEQLIALSDKATPGPWLYVERGGFPTITGEGFRNQSEPWFDIGGDADARFTSEARTAVPQLLKALQVAIGYIEAEATCPVCLTKGACNHYNIEGGGAAGALATITALVLSNKTPSPGDE